MSLTKEDLQAISDLIDLKLGEQDKKFDEKLDNFKRDFKEMLTWDNFRGTDYLKVIRELEERISKEIQEIKRVTADNCYNIVDLKTKIS